MNDGMDLMQELWNLSNQLNEALQDLEIRSHKKAESEKEYKILARQKALQERNAGVPITFISQFLVGEPEVAEKKAIRDIEEALYYTTQERINVLKIQIRLVNDQIIREYGVGNNSYTA